VKVKPNINKEFSGGDNTVYIPTFSEDSVIATGVNGGTNTKHHLSKFEGDLFHEEDHKCYPIVRIRLITVGKSERWKIYQDDKVIFVLEGNKLGKKEVKYLHTLEGFSFLLKQFKGDIKSFNALHKEIKAELKRLQVKKK
jgi:hypothetical protein